MVQVVLRFASVPLLLTCVLSAQTQKEATISSTAEVVTVPVVVTDSTGKPVRGLKQEEFKLQENGKNQRIASFEEVSATKPLRG